jgi:putative PIN family toxin of toxin-antitoxin system
MSLIPTSVVFDCMIYAQAMISRGGPSAACLDHVRTGELHLVWSDYVLQEIRELPTKLPARLNLTPERVEAFIADVAPFAQHVTEVTELYENPFDPDDSHYVNLAIASRADLITTRDGDLLRLMDETNPEAREFRNRFPVLRIIPPEHVLELLRHPKS